MIPRRFCVTLSLFVSLAPLYAQAPANRAETGAINGASFYIEVPAQWNKGLVMYTHGYTIAGSRPPAPDSGRMKAFRDVFLSRGFAFAASDYSVQGWAVKEAIEDTEALRRYFVSTYGAPSETYITGHSMGGHITMAIVERYPEVYQGAMPMCGPLGAAVDFLNTGVFDMLVTFEALFPGTSVHRTSRAPRPPARSKPHLPRTPSWQLDMQPGSGGRSRRFLARSVSSTRCSGN